MHAPAHWPPFGLRIHTPRLELRAVDSELAAALAELAARGIHDADAMPFLHPWTDAQPPDLQRNTLRFFWTGFAGFQPDDWRLAFAVFEGGELVGLQDAFAKNYPIVRSFETGSWLGRAFQGRGIGKEMRAAVLHLLFDGLGAAEAITGAFLDNAPSLAVTRSLGYEPNGIERVPRRDEAAEVQLFRLRADTWRAARRDDITYDGVTADLLAFMGLADPPA